MKKKSKIFERWGLCPQTPNDQKNSAPPPPLRISGYTPDYVIRNSFPKSSKLSIMLRKSDIFLIVSFFLFVWSHFYSGVNFQFLMFLTSETNLWSAILKSLLKKLYMITFKNLPQIWMYVQTKNAVVEVLLLHDWVEDPIVTNLIIPEINTGNTVMVKILSTMTIVLLTSLSMLRTISYERFWRFSFADFSLFLLWIEAKTVNIQAATKGRSQTKPKYTKTCGNLKQKSFK